MQVSAKGMIDIMSHEGICLEPYLDSVGVWTIGVGQTAHDGFDPRKVGKLTVKEAIDLFKRKIKPYAAAVDALGLDLKQHQYDALVSLCYNFGPGNLRKLCNGRSLAEIGEAIMLYTKPPEITGRRRKEQALFKSGLYSNTDGKVLVFPVVNNHPRYRDGYKVDVRASVGLLAPASLPKKTGGAAVAAVAAATATQQAGLPVEWIIGVGVAVAVVAFLIWKLKGK